MAVTYGMRSRRRPRMRIWASRVSRPRVRSVRFAQNIALSQIAQCLVASIGCMGYDMSQDYMRSGSSVQRELRTGTGVPSNRSRLTVAERRQLAEMIRSRA